ncbi:MAG TPA: hypothetical protein VEW71_02195 [Allosphingosinicella sp.]|nr:hypothetical protein [Allosphingosinicella sp.]
MRASPQLLILETAVGLFEERLEAGPITSRPDLLLLGRQLHRLNGLYIRLVETTTGMGVAPSDHAVN